MRTTLAVAALLALAAPATGAPTFDYVSRFSQIQIAGELPGAPPPQDWYYASLSTSGFGLFDESLNDELLWAGVSAGSEASQTSHLESTSAAVVGWTHMQVLSNDGTGAGSAWARSELELVFDLSEAAPIELTGWVHTPPGSGPPSGLACEASFWQWVGGSWEQLYGALYESPVAYATTLPPGRYRLNTEAYIEGDTDFGEFPIMGATYFDVTLQIVPEPATLALFLLAFLRFRPR
jgi:hypothetical protein